MAALPRVERWEVRMLSVEQFTIGHFMRVGLLTGTLLVLSLAYIVSSSFNPFIYFRF
jgi:alginate O-acetyltransferase complex protein AlgI